MNNNSFDINVRTLDFHNRKIEIHYVSSLCSDELIAYLVEGITNAKGKTLKERARELIKIAHPDFRDELTQKALEKYKTL